MQELGRLLPTYWIASLGEWSLQGAELPVTGLVVIGVWTLVLGVLCMVSMSRAVGLQRR
jgi:ABC-2 type transport system permease protein